MKIISQEAEENPRLFAVYDIVPAEVFCDAKMRQIYFRPRCFTIPSTIRLGREIPPPQTRLHCVSKNFPDIFDCHLKNHLLDFDNFWY